MYFNYHGKAKKLIKEGHCTGFKMIDSYHGISPCLLLILDDDSVLPIRSHKFDEYRFLLFENNVKEKSGD